jgi:hypothetical protein
MNARSGIPYNPDPSLMRSSPGASTRGERWSRLCTDVPPLLAGSWDLNFRTLDSG